MVKLQCVIHQWVRLNELYKLMECFFFEFQISFRNFGRKLKNIQKNRRREYWQIAMCYTSIDSSQPALQTNEKFFFQISESFFDRATFFLNNSRVGFSKRGGGVICADLDAF